MKKNVMEETDFIVKKMSCQEKQKNGVRLQHLSSQRNVMCKSASVSEDNRHDDHEAVPPTNKPTTNSGFVSESSRCVAWNTTIIQDTTICQLFLSGLPIVDQQQGPQRNGLLTKRLNGKASRVVGK
jgi:hypothetical protein